MKIIVAILSVIFTLGAHAQDLDLPPPPASEKYEDASTRGAELCMNINYVLALELKAAMSEKHKKTPFIDPSEILLVVEFENYRERMLDSTLLGMFLTETASDLIDGFIPDEDTLKKVTSYYLKADKLEVEKTLNICTKYVNIITPKVDPGRKITLALAGQRKLLSEDLLKEMNKSE